MRILVIGSGGREHALCCALASSPLCDTLFCAPGNAGIAKIAECIPISAADQGELVAFANRERIDFVVVGPEQPLVEGLVNTMEAQGIKTFGPTREAAILEGSKAFMKDFCQRHAIPTAPYRRFRKLAPARRFIQEIGLPAVIKADGLAAGKGVVVATTHEDAEATLHAMLSGSAFGDAGREVIVEAFLEGSEVSVFALADGMNLLPLASAQDYKKIGEGDTGPNTGGMGAISPAPALTGPLLEEVMARILVPTVNGMAEEGRPFKGVLYAGLMLTKEGPQLLEYNVRFGDPECQVICALLQSDLLTALLAASEKQLGNFALRWRPEAALCVVMAAAGYPGTYHTGQVIHGLDNRDARDKNIMVFHSGTRRDEKGQLVTHGGRVLSVTGVGATLPIARERVYAEVQKIHWEGAYYRRDIGPNAL